jgi:phosphoribosylformimino-5-aminoimidazole carboxamide ribonucleotide (ProFAR) isomerase
MKIIPAVDIKDGKCVQLVGGRLGTEKFYGDPAEVTKQWVDKGAEILHVVDLDAALGTGGNLNKLLY